MKVTSSKTIHLTEKEVKDAIGNWLIDGEIEEYNSEKK